MGIYRNIRNWILFLDLLCVTLSLVVARYSHHLHSFGGVLNRSMIVEWLPFLMAALAFWTIIYYLLHLDGFGGGWHWANMISQVGLGTTVFVVLLFSFAFLANAAYSRLVIVFFSVFVFAGFITIRSCTFLLLRSRLRIGAKRRVVILGNGNIARELARKISRHPELNCEVVGFLFPENMERPSVNVPGQPGVSAVKPIPTLGIVELLLQQNANELVIASPGASAPELSKLVVICRAANIGISMVPQWYELYMSKVQMMELDGLPMVSMRDHRPAQLQFALKRAMDLVIGGALFVLTLPFLGAAVLFLRRNGQVFTRETRCGRNGRPFLMWRLNIDRFHPERLSHAERVIADLSLTELPQLWNVLRGDMALVGPRPESPDRVQHYSDWQRQRLAVTPGLTGLAQIHGLRDQNPSEEKARYDLQYIFQWSPFLDLSIILQTCWTLMVRFSSASRPAKFKGPAPDDAVPRLSPMGTP